MLQHKSITLVAALASFVMVGRTSALLDMSRHTIHEQTVSANSCPLKVLDFGGNELATTYGMVSSTIFTTCPTSSTTYPSVAPTLYTGNARVALSTRLMRDIALQGRQVYHIESIPVIQHDIYTKVWLPQLVHRVISKQLVKTFSSPRNLEP